jgi:hypothetical protein
MKQRLHWTLTITALVVAVCEVTPLGSATVRTGVAATKAPLYASGILQRGPRGPRGRRGPRGPRGNPGPQRPRGEALVARARSSGAVTTPSDDPLTGNTWTQGAAEDDLIVATITFQPPSTCTTLGQPPLLGVQLKLDGTPAGGLTLNPVQSGTTVTFATPVYVFAPGADTPRTLTAMVYTSCEERFTVTDLELDVGALT